MSSYNSYQKEEQRLIGLQRIQSRSQQLFLNSGLAVPGSKPEASASGSQFKNNTAKGCAAYGHTLFTSTGSTISELRTITETPWLREKIPRHWHPVSVQEPGGKKADDNKLSGPGRCTGCSHINGGGCMDDKSLYSPKPIDLENVNLSEGLDVLTEEIAENIHDVWARKRLDEGWRWGEERSDKYKTHPCLVPYANLPEQEKAYDREIVTATIKMLVVLGYKIERARFN